MRSGPDLDALSAEDHRSLIPCFVVSTALLCCPTHSLSSHRDASGRHREAADALQVKLSCATPHHYPLGRCICFACPAVCSLPSAVAMTCCYKRSNRWLSSSASYSCTSPVPWTWSCKWASCPEPGNDLCLHSMAAANRCIFTCDIPQDECIRDIRLL